MSSQTYKFLSRFEMLNSSRCFHLARLHCIHPTPSYSSAVQLLSRAVLSTRQARSSLFESDIPIQEGIVDLPASSVDELSSNNDKLDLAAKRALFAERVPKPVFFDTAFNYIDMPLDELLELAGKKEAVPANAIVTEKVKEAAVPVVESVKKVIGRERSREATPAGDEPKAGEKPKGWLGGWFGRGS